MRLAWLATHPTQYQAPLLRAIAAHGDIDLTVIYFSDFSIKEFIDPGFGQSVNWDVPLLDGYEYEFLFNSEIKGECINTFHPLIRGLSGRLTKKNFDAVLVQGWQHYGMVQAAWLAKRAGLKVFLRCEATDHVSNSRGLKKFIRDSVVKFLLSQVSYCLAIGTRNRNFYLNRKIPLDKIGLMPYCVDNTHFSNEAKQADLSALRVQLGIGEDRPILLYVGKFTNRKFPDKLLEAYQLLPEPRPYLIYVGDGELRSSMEDFVSKNQLEGVIFAGFRNQGELPAFYALADIFILPSVGETWGLVINEAMNAGCAIVTTVEVGAAPDLVIDGVNGIVINDPNIYSLRDALNECLTDNKFLLMGAESARLISSWGIPENIAGLRSALDLEGVSPIV